MPRARLKTALETMYIAKFRMLWVGIEGFDVAAVKAKNRSIRNAYILERVKITKSKTSGRGADEVYKPNVCPTCHLICINWHWREKITFVCKPLHIFWRQQIMACVNAPCNVCLTLRQYIRYGKLSCNTYHFRKLNLGGLLSKNHNYLNWKCC